MSAEIAEQEVAEQVSVVVARARAIEVSSPEQATDATAFLSEIKAAQTRSEKSRKFIVDPFNKQIRAINARFKDMVAPLNEADVLVRSKVLAYTQEQERIRAQEQARLDAERRAAEEQAEAERRRLAGEAQRAEQEAAEAEQRRQAEMAAATSERRGKIAALDDQTLEAIVRDPGTLEDQEAATEELDARKVARGAQERAAAARREAEEATQREIAAKSAPALAVTAPVPLSSTAGSASVRKEWRATVIDESEVPDEYKVIDTKKINAVVKAGVREIPGVKIEQVAGLSVRAGR